MVNVCVTMKIVFKNKHLFFIFLIFWEFLYLEKLLRCIHKYIPMYYMLKIKYQHLPKNISEKIAISKVI